MYFRIITLAFLSTFLSCSNNQTEVIDSESEVYLKVLGVAQDAGYPQVGCKKECCQKYWSGKEHERLVVSLGLVDKRQNKVWMFEATPDFKKQYQSLISELDSPDSDSFGGIFLTHAHMGHYTGLMQVGFEAMNGNQIPVYAMPRMKRYLETNGPWGQLITKNNIVITELMADSLVHLGDNLQVSPFLVPHRDEYSETVGFTISANKKAIFIPDINKWSIWERNIVAEVKKVDIAFLDASFLDQKELPNRDMTKIPHPFVSETVELFDNEAPETKKKVTFIHFNHTNKLIFDGPEANELRSQGYNIARNSSVFSLN